MNPNIVWGRLKYIKTAKKSTGSPVRQAHRQGSLPQCNYAQRRVLRDTTNPDKLL